MCSIQCYYYQIKYNNFPEIVLGFLSYESLYYNNYNEYIQRDTLYYDNGGRLNMLEKRQCHKSSAGNEYNV